MAHRCMMQLRELRCTVNNALLQTACDSTCLLHSKCLLLMFLLLLLLLLWQAEALHDLTALQREREAIVIKEQEKLAAMEEVVIYTSS